MKIKEVISQNRRDFTALFECEKCGNEEKKHGYDDRNYHDNVIPVMECKKCGKSRNDLGIKQEATSTKYPDWLQV